MFFFIACRLQRIESEYEDMKEKMPTLQQQILKLRSVSIEYANCW